uniref:EF-hand domain-containing protein n=1 Tax=Hemiselmis andersenii TaxID=464988 RepID=A0A6U4UIT3_HEMAN
MARNTAEEARIVDLVEKAVHAILYKLKDKSNSFYRSKGCRDLLSLEQKHPGFLDKSKMDRELWIVTVEMLIPLATKDIDEDVKKFAEKALFAMNAEFDEESKQWVTSDKALEAKQKAAMLKTVGDAAINESLMDGEPVYRQYNAWRTALLRSIRENRTVSGAGNLELIALRANGTRMNRVVNFRGFLPDRKGEPGDRLYYVTDSNVEKAEQVARDTEGYVLWKFKKSNETYIITGQFNSISSYRGEKYYDDMEPVKRVVPEEDPSLIQYRRIAWNASPDAERDGFLWPEKQILATDRHTDGLMRLALQGLCMNPVSHMVQEPTTVFERIDKDRSGTVNYEEFCLALKEGKVFMGEPEKKQLWDFLDSDKGGEVEYEEFNRYAERTHIPDNFLVMYIEPFKVERIGPGDQYGHPEEGGAVYRWLYELMEDESWSNMLMGAE